MSDDLRERIARTETRVDTLEARFIVMEQVTQDKFDEVIGELRSIREQMIEFFGGLKLMGKLFGAGLTIAGLVIAGWEIFT